MFKITSMFNESHNNASFTACLVRMGMIVLFSVALLLTLYDLASASGRTVSLLPQVQVGVESETGSIGASCNIKTECNYKSNDIVNSSDTQPLSNLPIGAKVVDHSWEWQFRTGNNFSGAGETKSVTWIVVAKNHYGASSGVTLISEELIGLHLFDNSTNRGSGWGSNHWGDSGTNNATRGSRTFLNSTGIDAWTGFYFAFSESFKSNIITTVAPNKTWDTETSYITQDKVFIPSATELGDTTHSSTYQIGTVYPYFEGSTDADRLAKLDGINRFYFTRSPNSTHAGVVRSVDSGGRFNDNSADNSSGGLRPALNIQFETPVSINPNADGSYSFSVPASTCSIQVNINPSEARTAGAKWRLTTGPDTRWKNHNATISNLPAGTYTIRFRNVTGWARPADIRVRLGAGDELIRRGTYTAAGATGSIQARIVPVGARNDGARWRLTTGPDTRWKNHNATISNLPAGTYTIRFRNVTGWARPADIRVRLGASDELVRRGSYIRR